MIEGISEARDDITTSPYLLQLDIISAKNIPKADLTSSDPYIIVKLGNIEVARTRVIKFTLNPNWDESFTVPLLHTRRSIELEMWDWNGIEEDVIIGKLSINLGELGINSSVEESFPVEQAGKFKARGTVRCGIFLEKRKDMIKLNHKPPGVGNSAKVEFTHSFSLIELLKKEFCELKAMPSVQEAVEQSDYLKQKEINCRILRDVIFDMHSLTHGWSRAIGERVETLNDIGHSFHNQVPMSLNRVDSCYQGLPAKFSKSTVINFNQSSTCDSYISCFKTRKNSFAVETDTGNATLFARNIYLMWTWIRSIRRSYVASNQRSNSNLLAKDHSLCEALKRFHVSIDFSADDEVFQSDILVRVGNEVKECSGVLNFASKTLHCQFNDTNLQSMRISLDALRSLSIPQDYALHQNLKCQFNLVSAKFVLSRASRQSSYNSKSTFQQMRRDVTHVSGIPSFVVVNFLDGRLLVSSVFEGISPYYDICTSFGLSSKSVVPNESSDKGNELSAFHIHMLSGSRGSEKVLGSKIVQYSELFSSSDINAVDPFPPENVYSFLHQTEALSKVIELDEDFGLEVEVLRGENLILPDFDTSQRSLFDWRPSSQRSFDPQLELSCVGFGDSTDNVFKKFVTKAQHDDCNPIWNETFIINTADGLHSAKFVQLLLKDHSRGISMGAAYLPISEFFSSQLIRGESKDVEYSIRPIDYFSQEQRLTPSGEKLSYKELGTISLRISLIREHRSCSPKKLNGAKVALSNMNVVPIEVEISTQLLTSNEYSSYYLCDCISASSLRHIDHDRDSRIERFSIAAASDSLVLAPFCSYESELAERVESALLHQFRRHMRRSAPDNISKCEDIVLYYFYENQRSDGLKNFTASNLTSFDRTNFTDESGYFKSPFNPEDIAFKPIAGYAWDAKHDRKWTIDFGYTETDEDGWSYGVDFNHLSQQLRRGHSSTHVFFHNVRRRRWQRIAVLIDGDSTSRAMKEHPSQRRVMLRRSFARKDLNQNATFSVFHNQRRGGFTFSWGDEHLMLFERHKYSNSDATQMFDVKDIDLLGPPPGYRWADGSTWEVDKEYLKTDDEGWVYGIDFASIERDYCKHTSSVSAGIFTCRRRKLVRRIIEDVSNSSFNISDDQVHEIQRQFTSESASSLNGHPVIESREEGFEKDRDSIMAFCKERCYLHGPVCIPWQQVHHIDVITPSVLSVRVTVHRFVGEMGFVPVNMEVFVYECPAEDLCSLMHSRILMHPLRVNLMQLITSGSLTGSADEEYVYHSASSDGETVASLSLGAATYRSIFFEMEKIDREINFAEQALSDNEAGDLVANYITKEICHLKNMNCRLQYYARLLFASGLRGPMFDKATVRRIADFDTKLTNLKFSRDIQGDPQSEVVQSLKDAVAYLLHAAEARICDYSLAGWAKQGPEFVGILSTLVNEYYIGMIESIGYFFESSEVLSGLKGNSAKLALIEFVLENDSTFARLVKDTLNIYDITIAPEPQLSLSLDLQRLLEWYVIALRNEITTFVDRTFQVNCTWSVKSSLCSQEKILPWEVINNNGILESSIPLDVIMLFNNYFNLMYRAHSSEMPVQMRSGLTFLYLELRIIQTNSFTLLVDKYYKILRSHDWTVPVCTKDGKTITEDEAHGVINEHLLWLSSVGNDMIRLHSSAGDFCNMNCDLPQSLTVANANFFKRSMATLDIAVDYMSCIVFHSFEKVLPFQDILKRWCSENTVERVVKELIWFVDSNSGNMSPLCTWRLLEICMIKFSVWYFALLDECHKYSKSKKQFDQTNIERIIQDCDTIFDVVTTKIKSIRTDSAGSMDFKVIGILTRFRQIKAMLEERPGSSILKDVFSALLKESEAFPERSAALAKLIRIVFSLRVSVHEDESNAFDDNDDHEAIDEWILVNVEIVASSMESNVTTLMKKSDDKIHLSDYTPEQLVWCMDKTLHDLLLNSASFAS